MTKTKTTTNKKKKKKKKNKKKKKTTNTKNTPTKDEDEHAEEEDDEGETEEEAAHETGEAADVALVREIKEELGIKIVNPAPLIKIKYDYPDKSVLLDVWSTTHFEGKPQGLEGQTIQWCSITALTNFDFPAANKPIIEAIQATEF